MATKPPFYEFRLQNWLHIYSIIDDKRITLVIEEAKKPKKTKTFINWLNLYFVFRELVCQYLCVEEEEEEEN